MNMCSVFNSLCYRKRIEKQLRRLFSNENIPHFFMKKTLP